MKIFLITGATSGVGRAAALALAKPGTHLILTGQKTRAGQRLVERCRRVGNDTEAEFLPADLGNLNDVRRLAEAVKNRVSGLDALVNNAGARFDQYEETKDGVERSFAINHLGHFLLTALLLDWLLAAPSARIVVTGSSAHHHVDAEGDWCLGEVAWSKRVAYGKSKLANIVFAYSLARRLGSTRTTVNAVDPGCPFTRFARNNGLLSWLKHVVYHGVKGELTSVEAAGRLVAQLASDEAFTGVSGHYVSPSGEVDSSMASHDRDAANRLWNLSLKLSGLDERLGPVWKYLQPAA